MSNNEQESRWIYYEGISLTDLEADEKPVIDVLIPSLSPGALDGALDSGKITRVTSFFDHNGSPQQSETTTANHVKATWYGESNNPYPPLVKKNEQVKVRQYGNSDQYYWESYGRDSRLRTLDRKRIEISATPHTGQRNTDNNTYFVEMDSVTGHIRIRTNKENGEPFAYIINIDTKKGQMTLSDDKEGGSGFNKIFIDSNHNIVHMSNNDGVTYHAEGKNLDIEAPDSARIKAGKQIYFESPMYTFNRNSSNSSVMVYNIRNITYNGTSSVSNFDTVGYNASGVKINSPLVAGGIRSPSYANGPVGESYNGSTTDVKSVSSNIISNSPDTDVSGLGDRHSAAAENVIAAFQATAEAIKEVASAVPTNADTSKIISNATASIMMNLKGN